jgi:hypothetical protein
MGYRVDGFIFAALSLLSFWMYLNVDGFPESVKQSMPSILRNKVFYLVSGLFMLSFGVLKVLYGV